MIRFLVAVLAGIICQIMPAFATIHIVAAENFYGEVAKELGGDQVKVTSILQNPAQDPHLFTTSPAVAKTIAEADIVVYNGANYDDWMDRLLSVSSQTSQKRLVVADLMGTKAGENPHIWYIPTTMARYADALSQQLVALDPPHAKDYVERLRQFQSQQTLLQQRVGQLKKRVAGMQVTATEPVFNWMAEALSLKMRNLDFQWSIENEGSPSPVAVKSMLDDLKNHQVRVLFYNAQVVSPLVDRIKAVAEENKIPVIGVTETQPPGMSYHQWMQRQLEMLEKM